MGPLSVDLRKRGGCGGSRGGHEPPGGGGFGVSFASAIRRVAQTLFRGLRI
jgi:hypothetical protein